jgi:hypothetical protein
MWKFVIMGMVHDMGMWGKWEYGKVGIWQSWNLAKWECGKMGIWRNGNIARWNVVKWEFGEMGM